MYYAPLGRIEEFVTDPAKQLKLLTTCNKELVNLHFGQNWDIHWHNGHSMPTEEQYLQMVINKTSVLPRLCAGMISIILPLPDLEKRLIETYIESLGAAFQI